MKDITELFKKVVVNYCLSKQKRLMKLMDGNEDLGMSNLRLIEELIDDYDNDGPHRRQQERRLMNESFKSIYIYNKFLNNRIQEERKSKEEIELARIQDRLSQD